MDALLRTPLPPRLDYIARRIMLTFDAPESAAIEFVWLDPIMEQQRAAVLATLASPTARPHLAPPALPMPMPTYAVSSAASASESDEKAAVVKPTLATLLSGSGPAALYFQWRGTAGEEVCAPSLRVWCSGGEGRRRCSHLATLRCLRSCGAVVLVAIVLSAVAVVAFERRFCVSVCCACVLVAAAHVCPSPRFRTAAHGCDDVVRARLRACGIWRRGASLARLDCRCGAVVNDVIAPRLCGLSPSPSARALSLCCTSAYDAMRVLCTGVTLTATATASCDSPLSSCTCPLHPMSARCCCVVGVRPSLPHCSRWRCLCSRWRCLC